MSTSETTDFPVADCPCGKGKILKFITTQDNPWSSADISYGISCSKCSSEWDISSYGGTLTNRESERPHNEAYRAEREIAGRLHAIIDGLVDQYFEDFAAKTMTAELREMQRLGISRLNIDQFRKAKRAGRRPSENAYALKNLEWLSRLAKTAGKEPEFQMLRGQYEEASRKTKETSANIITRKVPASYP